MVVLVVCVGLGVLGVVGWVWFGVVVVGVLALVLWGLGGVGVLGVCGFVGGVLWFGLGGGFVAVAGLFVWSRSVVGAGVFR